MVATELLKLAMETEEGRKERLKKMVANHSDVMKSSLTAVQHTQQLPRTS